MPSVFTGGRVGSVARMTGIRTVTFSLLETDPTIAKAKTALQGFSMQDNVNVQFTHTMGDDIYMNVFGNRMGVLTIDGVSFNAEASGGACDNGPHGIIKMIEWYEENRASNRLDPIEVKISGQAATQGFLIAATYRANDPMNWVVSYQMQVATVPRT
jgi:hypothetical protein